MAIFPAINSRWSVIGALATLCFTGAVCGSLYSFLVFGPDVFLLISGALAGALITFLYGLLELKILPKSAHYSLTKQYLLRVVCYYALFLLSLFLISLLHARFSQLLSGYDWFSIFMEDYLPLWPAYLIYALLAAFVFQSVWLFNKVNSKSNADFSQQHKNLKTTSASVFVIALQPEGSVSQDRIIALLNKLSSAMLTEKNGVIEYYDDGKLKIYYDKKPLSAEEITDWESKLHQLLKNHITPAEKMLQLQMGYAFGQIHLQICGMQTIFYGEAVQKAQSNLKFISPSSKNPLSALPAFPLII
ncbi:MAG: hypothetical protein ACXWDO_02755 [Bacteroidia bacterium]